MNKPLHIKGRTLAFGLIGWFAATNLLIGLAQLTGWWPLQAAAFLCLSFLPGIALLRAMRIALRTFTARLLYSFGLSLLTLILSGLAANQLLPMVGMPRPLELAGALGMWDIFTATLITASIFFNRTPIRLKAWSLKKVPKLSWLFIGVSVLLPCVAALGAFRLNNGGDALLAIGTLCFVAVLIVCTFVLRNRLSAGLLAWLIFTISLTILLMTSLRGWDIVGHDIEREFRVYTLAHANAHWDIALDRDPYNACLSITILPEMFARILGITGLVVFKLILQIIFAACPVVVFVLLRQYSSKLASLVGSLLFICYPTFINDSAMLTRQGVAYLFFALALLVISNETLRKRFKVLFLLCALGTVLSHYSTAYMFVALFVAASIIKLCVVLWHRPLRNPFQLVRPKAPRTILSPLFAGLVFLMTFLWYTQITATSGGLTVTLQKSFTKLPELFTADNKSSDTSSVLLFAGGKTQADLYESYLETSHEASAPKTAGALQYMPGLTSDDLPFTELGKTAKSVGIDAGLLTSLRQNFAKILQLLALIGVFYITYRLLAKKPDALGPDFVYLSLAGVMLLALMAVLPILSINYGILRAFQQALIFLILPITLLLAQFGRRLWGWLKTLVATLGIVLLFLTFSGMFAQMLGGASPTLSMNNRGLYHGLYYSPEADHRAFAWLKEHVPKGNDVRAANFNRAFMHDPDYPFSRVGILPFQVGGDSIVYLDQAQVLAQKFYTYHESSSIIMTFPLNFYDDTKNQIYSTTTTRIYK